MWTFGEEKKAIEWENNWMIEYISVFWVTAA
jgi:hypothetical protein